MVSDKITVREVKDIESMLACTELQRKAWGFADIDCIPIHVYVAQIHSGGNLFAAYADEEKEPAGFAFLMASFGKNNGKQNIMQMIAVSPEHQNKDVSRAIARKIVDWAKEKNIKKITWTYDPLQGANANTYFNKFGATTSEYLKDLYGKLTGEKNEGLETDRFEAVLDVNSERTNRLFTEFKAEFDPNIKTLNRVLCENGMEVPSEPFADIADQAVYVRIPADFTAILNKSPELAKKWRTETRKIFDEYMNKRGYVVTEFASVIKDNKRENYYLLERLS